MLSRTTGLCALGAGVVALAISFTNLASAGSGPAKQAPREVTLEGRIVDLHCAMTEQFASADHAKCTSDCIRAGVPAALETDDGYVLLGQGTMGAAKTVIPHAFKEVEVRGKLYTKSGLQYLDITSVEPIAIDMDFESDDEQ